MTFSVLRNYPNYKIYEDGTIECCSTKKCIMKPGVTTDGYDQVNVLSLVANNGYRHSIKVHRLVAMAFLPNPMGLKEVNHKDGNKKNNHYLNLEWCTRGQNIKHAYDLGLRTSDGARNASSKIKEEDVIRIRMLYSSGSYTQKQLGGLYGLTQAHIGYIVNRKNWAHI